MTETGALDCGGRADGMRVLAEFQAAVARGKAERGNTASLVDELPAGRAAEPFTGA